MDGVRYWRGLRRFTRNSSRECVQGVWCGGDILLVSGQVVIAFGDRRIRLLD